MQRFGEKLRTLRMRRGMTLRELAVALGYASYSYLGLLEIGKRKPTADVIMRAAEFFQVTTDQLLWDYLELDEERTD